jgi:hypothetical protein
MAEHSIDGKATLKQQEDTLRLAEAGGPFSLVAYTKGTSVPPDVLNKATFVDVPFGQKVPLLNLVEVPSGKSLESVIQANGGNQPVFAGLVFVKGAEMMVAGFRDKA